MEMRQTGITALLRRGPSPFVKHTLCSPPPPPPPQPFALFTRSGRLVVCKIRKVFQLLKRKTPRSPLHAENTALINGSQSTVSVGEITQRQRAALQTASVYASYATLKACILKVISRFETMYTPQLYLMVTQSNSSTV